MLGPNQHAASTAQSLLHHGPDIEYDIIIPVLGNKLKRQMVIRLKFASNNAELLKGSSCPKARILSPELGPSDEYPPGPWRVKRPRSRPGRLNPWTKQITARGATCFFHGLVMRAGTRKYTSFLLYHH